MSERERDAGSHIALAKALDLAAGARKNHSANWSGFLDPVSADKFYEVLSKERGVRVRLFGGYGYAERQMLGVCVDYLEIADEDFPIDVLDINYDSRFSRELSHRDFLGSILGLGIDRNRVGDIVVEGGAAHVFICREMSGYVIANLERVGNAKVKVGLGKAGGIPEPSGQEMRLTVASLRLDAIISAGFNLSRGKAMELIAAERAFVNWSMQKSASAQVNEGDMVTVRGLGRVKLAEVGGRTKKGRLGIAVVRY
jgi:RNA-binding protein YlmH